MKTTKQREEIQRSFDHDAALGSALGLSEEAGTNSAAVPAGAAPGLLRQVDLKHFGSHTDSRIRITTPVTLIVGQNNAGKTTLTEALLWALTGRFARGVDAGGRGADVLVQDGAAAMRVGVELNGVGWVKRGLERGKLHFRVGESIEEEKVQQVDLYRQLRTSQAFVHAVFTANAFLDAPHAEAKAFVLGLCDVRVPIGTETLSLEQLQARYQSAFEMRRDAKARRAAVVVPDKPAEDELTDDHVLDLEVQLTDLRAELTTLTADGAEARGRRTALEAQLATLTRELQTLERRIPTYGNPHEELDALERALQAANAPPPADVRAAVDAEDTEVATLNTQLVDLQGRLRVLQTAETALKAHSPTKSCVLDPDIPCKTPAKAFTDRGEVIPKEINALTRQAAELAGRLNLLTAAVSARQDDATQADRQRKALERDHAAWTSKAKDKQTDDDRLVEVRAAIASTTTEIEALGPIATNPEAEALQARITRGEQTIKEAAAVARQWVAYRAAGARADALNRDVDELEARVELLGPKGAQVQAIAGALEGFLGRINPALGAFGYVLDIQLEPWKLLVNGRSVVRLSPTERMRVGVALQLAIAEISGLNLAAFDDIDRFIDQRIRDVFTELVFGWAFAEPGRQVLIVKATEDAAPHVEGMAVYRAVMTDRVSTVVLEHDGASTVAA